MSIAAAWSDVIRANWATCQLFIDLRTGSYQDLSANARVVTAVGLAASNWESGRGLGIRSYSSAQYLSVPHAAELSLIGGGTLVHMHPSRPLAGALEMYICKTDNGGVNRSYDFGPTNSWLNGWLASSARGCRSAVMAWTNAGSSSFYADGVQTASYPGAVSTACNENVVIGVLFGIPASNLSVSNQCALIFSTRLTGAEISQLHNDFMASGFAL